MSQPTFSHVPYTSDYMEIAVSKVKNHFKDDVKNKKVLDIPAGNGWIGDQLTEYGMKVISADINEDKLHFDQGFNLDKKEESGIFLNTYKDFVHHISSTIFKEKLIYQRKPTLRIHFPKNMSVGGFHRDRDYNHPIEEINIWVPITLAFNTNTIWIESKFDKEDYSPMNLNYGQAVIFDSGLKHGNKINVENLTRLSFDFRVIPLSKWAVADSKKKQLSSISQNLKFTKDAYYDVTT